VVEPHFLVFEVNDGNPCQTAHVVNGAILEQIGLGFTNDVEEANVVVVDSMRCTMSMVTAVAQKTPLVTPLWVDECVKRTALVLDRAEMLRFWPVGDIPVGGHGGVDMQTIQGAMADDVRAFQSSDGLALSFFEYDSGIQKDQISRLEKIVQKCGGVYNASLRRGSPDDNSIIVVRDPDDSDVLKHRNLRDANPWLITPTWLWLWVLTGAVPESR